MMAEIMCVYGFIYVSDFRPRFVPNGGSYLRGVGRRLDCKNSLQYLEGEVFASISLEIMV